MLPAIFFFQELGLWNLVLFSLFNSPKDHFTMYSLVGEMERDQCSWTPWATCHPL